MKKMSIGLGAIAPASSLIVARIIYAVNWFNAAALFPLIALEFNKDVSLLGSMTAAFFIGVGIFQLPAGIFAAKYNPRTSAIFGIATSSTAAVLYGLASEASQLIWLRFIVGVGMAFFFSSAITLIAKYGKIGSPGFSIGMMNSAHSMGGIIGIFGWIVIAQIIGWRSSLILSGGLGLVTALLMNIVIPKSEGELTTNDQNTTNKGNDNANRQRRQAQFEITHILAVLSNRSLFYLGLMLTGIQAAWAVELTFIVVYLASIGLPVNISGVIASLPLISGIVSAPLIGRFSDRIKDTKKVLLACGIGMSIALAGISINNLLIVILSATFTGIFSGGAFTVVYATARTLPVVDITRTKNRAASSNTKQKIMGRDNDSKNEEYIGSLYSNFLDPIKVAWVNGLSLMGVLWMPIAFSFIVMQTGYKLAWILSALVTGLFIIIPISKLSKLKNRDML
jgi:MFS family permease